MEIKNDAPQKLKIAIMGTRGVPARYGGFETFAEELGLRLVDGGHDVTVYCRRFFSESKKVPAQYKGIRQIFLPTFCHKYFETPFHSLLSFLHLFFARYDVVLLCNAANSPFSFIVRIRGLPLIINVDGIERKRSKWNSLGKIWYRIGELTSVWFATRIVADAKVIADYYLKTYRTIASVIAYGGKAEHLDSVDVLNELGVTPQKFILYVSRLEPENNALGVITAYGMAKTDLPLIIVGDAPYADVYKRSLKVAADQIMDKNPSKRVIFAGFRFGKEYHELQSHCYLYIQATEVGGTHPALVEAMAYGNCIIANGTPENIEVLAEAGEFYAVNNFEELANKIDLLEVSDTLRDAYRIKAKARVTNVYSWSVITHQYLTLFYDVIKK